MLGPILEEWDRLGLPDCWLAAGAISQTVWNNRFHLPAAHGISDIDIVYFDRDDLSEESEAQHAARIRDQFACIPAWIDVKNEARVHVWYEAKFGYRIQPYTSTIDAITTFPTTATAVGITQVDGIFSVEAPYGIDDLMNGIVRPNKKQITRDIYDTKVTRWTSVWPSLCIINWDEPATLTSGSK